LAPSLLVKVPFLLSVVVLFAVREATISVGVGSGRGVAAGATRLCARAVPGPASELTQCADACNPLLAALVADERAPSRRPASECPRGMEVLGVEALLCATAAGALGADPGTGDDGAWRAAAAACGAGALEVLASEPDAGG
jgi:hypothetical protein